MGFALLMLGSCCNKPACTVAETATVKYAKKLPVGLQLYSVRTDLEKDFYGIFFVLR